MELSIYHHLSYHYFIIMLPGVAFCACSVHAILISSQLSQYNYCKYLPIKYSTYIAKYIALEKPKKKEARMRFTNLMYTS